MRARSRTRSRKKPRFVKLKEALSDLLLHFIHLLTPKQWLGLLLLIIIATQHGVNAMNSMNQKPAQPPQDKEKNAKRKQAVNGVCTNTTMSFFNKPKVKLDIKNGIVLPHSCVVSGKQICDNQGRCKIDPASVDQKCKDDVALRKVYKRDDQAIDALRNGVDDDYDLWKKELSAQLRAFEDKLTKDDLVFYELISQISRLKETFIIARHAKAANGGCCEEHARSAERHLFFKNHEQQLELHLARVTLQSSITKLGHTFLLVSDRPFELIEGVRGRENVNDVLAGLQGLICDTWNYQPGDKLVAIQDNKNGYYNHEGLYDEIYVWPTPQSFSKAKLPSNLEARKLICDEIKNLEIPQDMIPATCKATGNSKIK